MIPRIILYLTFLTIPILSFSVNIPQEWEYPADDSITDPSERLAAWDNHLRLNSESPFRYLPLKSVGPRFQGGRVESIVGIPGNPYIIYAGIGAVEVYGKPQMEGSHGFRF